jgi:hypothetical protein
VLVTEIGARHVGDIARWRRSSHRRRRRHRRRRSPPRGLRDHRAGRGRQGRARRGARPRRHRRAQPRRPPGRGHGRRAPRTCSASRSTIRRRRPRRGRHPRPSRPRDRDRRDPVGPRHASAAHRRSAPRRQRPVRPRRRRPPRRGPRGAAAAIADAPVSPWRGEVAEADGVVVLNDAYNANPTSVGRRARDLVAVERTGRTWAVLGVMAEIGDTHDAEHRRGRVRVRDLGVDELVVVGDDAAGIADGARAVAGRRPRHDRAGRGRGAAAPAPARRAGRRGPRQGLPRRRPRDRRRGARRRVGPSADGDHPGGRPAVIAILVAGTVALVVALAGTPLVITYFRERGFGQFIREEGPEAHQSKAGTPTMGGTAIVHRRGGRLPRRPHRLGLVHLRRGPGPAHVRGDGRRRVRRRLHQAADAAQPGAQQDRQVPRPGHHRGRLRLRRSRPRRPADEHLGRRRDPVRAAPLGVLPLGLPAARVGASERRQPHRRSRRRFAGRRRRDPARWSSAPTR